MAKSSSHKQQQAQSNLSIFTQPWFVLAIVFACFAVLTPKIFIPIFRQITGIGRVESPQSTTNHYDRVPPPNLRSRQPVAESADYSRPGPQFGRPGPSYAPQTQGTGGGSSNKSLLTFLLPVYAVGIGLYMMYTLFKVFNKNSDKKEEDLDDESDFENIKSKNYKFKEKIYQQTDSEDYENLQVHKTKRKPAPLSQETEIPLSPSVGLASVTNTNVLMNDTLERMKHQLNKINLQLSHTEKKGGSLEDPELEDLRLQLSQTEQQMAKILNIVNTVSSSLKDKNLVYERGHNKSNRRHRQRSRHSSEYSADNKSQTSISASSESSLSEEESNQVVSYSSTSDASSSPEIKKKISKSRRRKSSAKNSSHQRTHKKGIFK